MHSSRANPDPFRPSPAASSAPPVLQAGDTLAKRYRLDREAGHTEAGLVFDAVDLTLNRRVAVEVASSIEDPKARRKWARDAMLAQRLEGEHVLRVLDVGNVAGDVPYAVREAALCTVAAEVEVKGALPIPLAAAWTLEACEAVAEAHALGMAHGDLRLDNIYLVRGTKEPSVKVAWTSAAKAELAAKEDVARDLAGLGAMLRILSTGRSGDDEADGAPTLPSDLAHAVSRALSIDPRERIQNVAELARMLAPYAPPGHPSARNVVFLMSRAGIVGGTIPGSPPSPVRTSSVPPVAVASSMATDRASFTDEWFGRSPRIPLVETLAPMPRRRARPAFAIVSVALIGLVLGGSWFLWQNGNLPRWTGVAPPEAVGKTEVTSGPAGPATTAEPTTAAPATAAPAPAEPATTSVESLPSAPATAATPAAAPAAPAATSTAATNRTHTDEPATTTPATTTGGAGLRYVDPPTGTTPTSATATPATPATTATAAPIDDSTSAPSPAPPPSPPASPDPVPSQPEQPPPSPGY